MSRIVLFRYHKEPSIVKNRLELIKRFNPDIQIYGLYGGDENEFENYSEELRYLLAGNYCLRDKTVEWKWMHCDLAVREWYLEYGNQIDFSQLLIYEWDLLFFKPIHELYNHVKGDGIALTALVDLDDIEKDWFWIRDSDRKEQWNRLLVHVSRDFQITEKPKGALFPGAMLSKKFLKLYSEQQIPLLCHDELRVPLYAQAFDIEIFDTYFTKKWFSKREWKYFNCNEVLIRDNVILSELSRKNGRRVFHPYNRLFDIKKIPNSLLAM